MLQRCEAHVTCARAMAPSAAKDALLRGLHAALADGSLADFTPKALEAIATNIFEHVTAEARTLERSSVTALPARLLVLSRKDLCDALAYGLARRVCDANAVATSADAFAENRGPFAQASCDDCGPNTFGTEPNVAPPPPLEPWPPHSPPACESPPPRRLASRRRQSSPPPVLPPPPSLPR